MRLITVWTMPGMLLRERLSRTAEWFWRSAAHHLPRRLAYWSFIDTGVRTIGNDVVPDVRYMDLLARVEGGPR